MAAGSTEDSARGEQEVVHQWIQIAYAHRSRWELLLTQCAWSFFNLVMMGSSLKLRRCQPLTSSQLPHHALVAHELEQEQGDRLLVHSWHTMCNIGGIYVLTVSQWAHAMEPAWRHLHHAMASSTTLRFKDTLPLVLQRCLDVASELGQRDLKNIRQCKG